MPASSSRDVTQSTPSVDAVAHNRSHALIQHSVSVQHYFFSDFLFTPSVALRFFRRGAFLPGSRSPCSRSRASRGRGPSCSFPLNLSGLFGSKLGGPSLRGLGPSLFRFRYHFRLASPSCCRSCWASGSLRTFPSLGSFLLGPSALTPRLSASLGSAPLGSGRVLRSGVVASLLTVTRLLVRQPPTAVLELPFTEPANKKSRVIQRQSDVHQKSTHAHRTLTLTGTQRKNLASKVPLTRRRDNFTGDLRIFRLLLSICHQQQTSLQTTNDYNLA